MKILFLFFVSAQLFAGQNELPSKLLGTENARAECVSSLKELSEFRFLIILPEFSEFLENPKTQKKLASKLLTWSSDLLMRISEQIDSQVLVRCPLAAPLEEISYLLKNVYLEKLGIKGRSKKESALLFRSFVTVKEELPNLKSQIEKKKRLQGSALLKAVYGYFEEIEGVTLLSHAPVKTKSLKEIRESLCGTEKKCLFWHPSSLWKIVVTEEKGVAAYVPELNTLVASRDLVEEPNVLMKIIFAHELAHSAEKAAHNLTRAKWADEFLQLIDYKNAKIQGERQDLLTELSKGSTYSILPDTVYRAGKKADGFVFLKGYEKSGAEHSATEDLADSIAVFAFFPARFCYKNEPFAPNKYEWIRKHVFPLAPELKCEVS